jgi:hypothetical protein
MELRPCMRAGLQLLLQASDYAVELQCTLWEFAVEIKTLREVGLTMNDLRWLLLKRFVQHAVEVLEHDQDERVFQMHGKRLAADSCFVLTASGIEFARVVTGSTGVGPGAAHGCNGHHLADHPSKLRPDSVRPTWDKDRRALWFGAQLVKQFKVPAPNQELILAAFDEEAWPSRIDDPLPMHPAIDPKRRLHDTINSLNRNQKAMLLRFQGDGTGEAICWSALAGLSVDTPAEITEGWRERLSG